MKINKIFINLKDFIHGFEFFKNSEIILYGSAKNELIINKTSDFTYFDLDVTILIKDNYSLNPNMFQINKLKEYLIFNN